MNHAQGGITGYEMQAVDEEIGQRLGQGREADAPYSFSNFSK